MISADPSEGSLFFGVLQGCDQESLKLTTVAKEYLAELAQLTDMTIIDGPRALVVDPRENDPGGVSTSTMWAESGAQTHSWPEWSGRLEANIHSCKKIDKLVVKEVTKKHYQPEKMLFHDLSACLGAKEPCLAVPATLVIALYALVSRLKGDCAEARALSEAMEQL